VTNGGCWIVARAKTPPGAVPAVSRGRCNAPASKDAPDCHVTSATRHEFRAARLHPAKPAADSATRPYRRNGNCITQRCKDAKAQRSKRPQRNGNSSNTARLPLLVQNVTAEVAADHHIALRCLHPADGPLRLCGPCAVASGRRLFGALRTIGLCSRKAASLARRCNIGSRHKTRPTATRLRRHDTSASRARRSTRRFASPQWPARRGACGEVHRSTRDQQGRPQPATRRSARP